MCENVVALFVLSYFIEVCALSIFRNKLDRFFFWVVLHTIRGIEDSTSSEALEMLGLTPDDLKTTSKTLNTFLKAIQPRQVDLERRMREIVKEELNTVLGFEKNE